MALTRNQRIALDAAPPADAIRTRQEGGRALSYLEGWYVIREANRIFGTDHWDRITLASQCVWQGQHRGEAACTYTARVRLCIRVGHESLVREGSGVGHGQNLHAGEAHGQAIKAAETDATKRALATLGAPFGLSLYETHAPDFPAAHGRSASMPASKPDAATMPATLQRQDAPVAREDYWMMRDAAGELMAVFKSPILCCSALRRAIEAAGSAQGLEALYNQNRRLLTRLRAERPDLRSDRDQHYAEILSALFRTRLKRLAARNDIPETTARAVAPIDLSDGLAPGAAD